MFEGLRLAIENVFRENIHPWEDGYLQQSLHLCWWQGPQSILMEYCKHFANICTSDCRLDAFKSDGQSAFISEITQHKERRRKLMKIMTKAHVFILSYHSMTTFIFSPCIRVTGSPVEWQCHIALHEMTGDRCYRVCGHKMAFMFCRLDRLIVHCCPLLLLWSCCDYCYCQMLLWTKDHTHAMKAVSQH